FDNLMKQILLLIFVTLFVSCDKTTHNKIQTDTIQKVLDFYDGECLIKKDAENNCYEIELSKSLLLNYDSESLDFHAGNIAYIFYTNTQIKDYDCVKIKINLDSKESYVFNYTVKELVEIESYIPNFNEVTNLIKVKDYDKLSSEFDESMGIDKQPLEELFSDIENNFGKLNDIYCSGFKDFETEECGEVIEFKAVLAH